MKSQPQESAVKTSCKNCAFAIYENNTQIDCAFGRIEKFKDSVTEAYDNEKEFYLIDRLCTYFRDKKWGYNDNDKDRVKEESAASFDVIFNCNEITDQFSDVIKNFLTNNNYYAKKQRVFLAHEYEKPVKDKIIALSKFLNPNTIVSCCYSFEEFVHEQAMKNKSAFHIIVDSKNQEFSSDWLNTINKVLNQDLIRFMVAKINGIFVVNNFLYKTLQYIEPCLDYRKNIENILYIVKKDMYQEIQNDS